ncbi:MAG: BamA/TamA family outer membrane protein, partial [Candidatus Kapaibacterium sp.]
NNIVYLGLDSLETFIKYKIGNENRINLIGERFSSELLSQDSGRVVNILRNQGYPFASGTPGTLGSVSIFEDSLNNKYLDSAILFFTTGSRYKFGKLDSNNFKINIGKASKTLNKKFIFDICPFNEGDWFSVNKLSEFEVSLRTLPFVSKLHMKNVIDTITNQIFVSIDLELTELSGLEGVLSFSLTGTESINDTTFYGFSASANGSYKKMNITGNADQIGFKGSITLNALTNFKQLLLNDYPNLSLGIEYLNSAYSVNFNVGYSSEKSPLNTSNELNNFFGNITFAKGIKFNTYTFFQRALLNFNLNYKEYIDINSYNAIEVNNIFSTLNGTNCVDTNRINGEISKLLIENIYKLQYSQGDDLDYVTNPLVKDNFDALKLKITLNGNLIHDKRNDFFNPTDGNILTLNTEIGTLGFKSFWLKLEYDYRWYYPLNANSSLAFRNHAGWIIEPSALKLTPPQSRFFVGGANSCRGWENNNLLATVPPPPQEFDPLIRSCIAPLAQRLLQKSISIFGGIGVFETSFDFRVSRLFKLPETNSFNRQLNNIGLIIFIDAGNAFYRDFQNESLAGTNILDHIAWSFGGSLTYNTPAGIIRFTPALQIYEPIYPNLNSISNRYFYKRFSDAWTFHISLGQAF